MKSRANEPSGVARKMLNGHKGYRVREVIVMFVRTSCNP